MDIYNSYDERVPDSQYQDTLRRVLDRGRQTISQQEVDAVRVIGTQWHFPLENGFPLITERDVSSFWTKGIDELGAMLRGARTLQQFEEAGVNWWGPWGTEEKCRKRGLEAGDLGPGSYGAVFADLPMPDGSGFNQVEAIFRQTQELPHLRTHLFSSWFTPYTLRGEGITQQVTICPCHGTAIHVSIVGGELTLHMFQRSGDLPVGVPSNIIQYAALALLWARLLGLKPVEYIHTISDAHMFTDQLEHVEELLTREPRPFPTVTLRGDINAESPSDLRGDMFELSDYHPHPAIKGIPVAV